MNSDLVLRCKKSPRFKFWSSKPRITLEGPEDLEAPAGALLAAPADWSQEHRYYDGDSDVSGLIDWLHDSLGSGLLKAISGFAEDTFASDTPARLFIAADDPNPLLATPWEVLEESHGDLQLLGNLNVIRSMPLDGVGIDDADIGPSLRVLVTWTDPVGDIHDLDEHRDWIATLPRMSDSAVAVQIVEFTDPNPVLDEARVFRPNVLYHVGHAEQLTAGGEVMLRIGARGKPTHLAPADYLKLLAQIGPRILVLNACSTITGRSLSPYIGLAQKCLAACESIICMQAEVPVGAAQRFGERLLTELANGRRLSHAVQRGRLKMVAGRKIGQRAVPLFTKFIPVHLTRERVDPSFRVDADARNTLRSRKRLEDKLEKVRPLLVRAVDGGLDALLTDGTGIALITGPAGSGKSTSMRGRIRALLETKQSSRFLYVTARTLPWENAPEHRVRQLLDLIVREYSCLTGALAKLLGEQSDLASSRAMTDLATWFAEEARAGRRNVVIIDDVPDGVAEEVAARGARSIDAGLLIVIARTPEVAQELPVARIEVPFMNEAEIGSAEVLARTGGMPYFVAAIERGEPLDGSLLDERIAAASESAKGVLRLAALSAIPLPRQWLDTIGGATEVQSLADSHLLLESDERMTIPEVVRNRIREEFPGDTRALRETLFAFLDRASHETAAGPQERLLALASKLEALRQALELGRFTDDTSWLDRAADLGAELHDHYLREAGDALSAKVVWDLYRQAAADLDRYFDRVIDTFYAEALAGVGSLAVADELLAGVIDTGEPDDLQVRALLLRSNVLKRIGGHGVFAERVALLEEAVTLARKLVAENPGDEDLQILLGNVEQSLGNALGYGAHARVADAERHLQLAAEIFERLGDPRTFRARGEIIEIRRDDGSLSEEERLAAIRIIRDQLEQLVTRDMRRDAVLHLYELGRLEREPAVQAQWFHRAYTRADGDFSPLDLHAGLHWKLCELAAGNDVEEEVEQFAEQLARWPEDSWSLRLRRDALAVLAGRALARGEIQKGAQRLDEALNIARHFQAIGEGRRDREAREALEREGGNDGHRR